MNIDETTTRFLRESNAIELVYDNDSLKQAISAWEYVIEEKELTISVILKTHKILMLHQPLRPDRRGYFRRVGVRVGLRRGKPWKQLHELMFLWAEDNKGKKTEEKIRQIHIDFEVIHPFVDGNGRIGRILMNWLRLKNGLGILVIKENKKYDYYKWFDEQDVGL